jgi:Concanavalin A-like lectin/glucanases superfamily
MSRLLVVRAGIFSVAVWFSMAAAVVAQVTWDVDNTTNIGGNAVTTVVGSPTVVSSPFGNALAFDGDDGIIVDASPIAGAANFTIEMLFRPDPIENASSNQPRVLHVQSDIPPDHRATLETRVVDDQWYLDAFLRSERPNQSNPSIVNSLTLSDANQLHPLGQWYNFAMTYDGSQLRAYVNGQLDLPAGNLAVLPMADGQVSLGMRANQVNFFEGVIAKVRFTPSLVDPEDFLSAIVPGDYDRNGTVDATDYDKWKEEFGTVVVQPGDGADGNSNGVVDSADYVVWRNSNPELGSGAQAESLPEPCAAVLLAFGILAIPSRQTHGPDR